MEKHSLIAVFGSAGMVGSAVVKKLKSEGYTNIKTFNHDELDLDSEIQTKWVFRDYEFEYIFQCAGKVGGIKANNESPVEFFQQNMRINANVLKYAHDTNVKKVVLFNSSCVYPKRAKQPIQEKELLSGYLESTNELFALAKISSIKLAQAYNKQYGTNFVNIMSCNLIGENDNFDTESSHLIPGIMNRIHLAKINNEKSVSIWGDGKSQREFMYVDDLAEISLWIMNNDYRKEMINIGTGKEYSITEISEMIKEVVGYEGKFIYDRKKPNGTRRKVLDISKMNALGLSCKVELRDGIAKLYEWYKDNVVKYG